MQPVGVFDMPNPNWYNILSISIFCQITLSISVSIFSRMAISIFIKLSLSIILSISNPCKSLSLSSSAVAGVRVCVLRWGSASRSFTNLHPHSNTPQPCNAIKLLTHTSKLENGKKWERRKSINSLFFWPHRHNFDIFLEYHEYNYIVFKISKMLILVWKFALHMRTIVHNILDAIFWYLFLTFEVV